MNRIEEISDLLLSAVPEVLGTMMSIGAIPMPPEEIPISGRALVVASVGFIGDVNGMIHLHVTASFARVLASKMLEMADYEFDGDEMINDAIGEVGNMVVGAVKSRLCDEGSPCVLTIPSIIRGDGLTVGAAGHTERRLLGFRCGDESILLELLMKSAS